MSYLVDVWPNTVIIVMAFKSEESQIEGYMQISLWLGPMKTIHASKFTSSSFCGYSDS